MGRRLPVIVCALLLGLFLAPPAGATGAHAVTRAAAPAVTRVIACPLSAGVVSPPCCGPPVAQANTVRLAGSAATPSVCCAAACCPVTSTRARPAIVPVCCPVSTTGTTACPVTGSLTITSAPNPSRTGAPVTISGTAGAGATVTLWQEAPPATRFTEVSTTTADTAGAYRFVRPAGSVTTNRSWYVTSGTAQSVTITQQVTAKVVFPAPPGAVRRGAPARLAGSVTPAQPGATVLLLQRAGKDWNVIARTRLAAGSRYVFHHRFPRAGTVRLRVELAANSRSAQSFSAARPLTVSPK